LFFKVFGLTKKGCLRKRDKEFYKVADRPSASDSYTFDGDTLIWDGTLVGVTFECDGGKMFYNGTFSQMWRLNSDFK
jgi:hypothetical protein